MDKALYSNAQMIRRTSDVFQNRLVLRLGEFHVIMCFLGVICGTFSLKAIFLSFFEMVDILLEFVWATRLVP